MVRATNIEDIRDLKLRLGQAVKPMYGRRTDWQIYAGLAKAIQEKAKAKSRE